MSLETARSLGPGRLVWTPQKNLTARPAGPREARGGFRDGPGSRGAAPQMASNWALDRPLEAKMACHVAQMVFGTLWKPTAPQLGLILGPSRDSLGPKNAIRIHVV